MLLAQKAFSNYDFYPLLSRYLAGTEASGLYEARLGKEEMPQGEVHVFCGAYREDEFQELLQYADHIVFNSIHQLKAFGPRGKQAGKSLGLRVNPECSTQEGHAIYDPCAPGSRMGVTRNVWDQEMDEATVPAGRHSLPYPVRAELRRFENHLSGGGGEVRGHSARNEMDQYGGRAPHHPPGL